MNLIKLKLSEFNNLSINLKEFSSSTKVVFENFTITFFRTNHSIPDSYGIACKTKLGYILHTGDFKFDFTPLANHTDFDKLTEYSKKGVLCLLSDSTNALVNKFSVSERKISESIKHIFKNIKGRILISTFASNIYRLQHIIEASVACGRKVIVFGRSMEKNIRIALESGYINVNESSFISGSDYSLLSDNKITIISTGSQGEPLAALSRMANGTHKQIKIQQDDTIIFSSSAIPGNQEGINRTINKLYKAGANVILNSPLTDTHTSGHGGEIELQMMLSLVKPQYFVPIHGEYAMQKRHIDLAVATGVKKENCFLLENGKVLTFNESRAFSLYAVPSGDVYIDEDYFDIDSNIIKERRYLSEDGLVSIIYSINKSNHLLQQPNIITRGFIYMKNTEYLMKMIKTRGEAIYTNTMAKNPRISKNALTNVIITELTNFITLKTDRKPIVIPIFMYC